VQVLKVAGWFAGASLAVVALAVTVLLSLDVHAYRGLLESGASAALKREVKFAGEMSLERSLWPTLAVDDVRIEPGPGTERRDLARIERLEIQVALLPLLWGEVKIEHLGLVGADVLIDGGSKTEMRQVGQRDPLQLPSIRSLSIERSAINYSVGTDRMRQVVLSSATAALSTGLPMRIEMEGSHGAVPFALSLRGGTPAELIEPSKPWPAKLDGHIARTSLKVNGTVAKPLSFDGFELDITMQGSQLSDLDRLLGLALPELGPYKLTGHVATTANRYTISRVVGMIGEPNAPNRLDILAGDVSLGPHQPLKASFAGVYKSLPFAVSMLRNESNELAEPRTWSMQVNASAGTATLQFDGEWVDNGGFTFAGDVSGDEVRELGALMGIDLLVTGSYALSGRIAKDDQGYALNDLRGRVGKTEIRGTLGWRAAESRPQVTGKLALTSIDLGALLVAVGNPEATSGKREPWPPAVSIPVDSLDRLDIDLDLEIGRIAGAAAPIRDVAVKAKLKDRNLTLAPFRMSLPGSAITGQLKLDTRGDTPVVALTIQSNQVHVGEILSTLGVTEPFTGKVERLHIELVSNGHTVKSILEEGNWQLTAGSADISYRIADTGDSVPFSVSAAKATASVGQPLSMVVQGKVRDTQLDLDVSVDTLANLFKARTSWPVTLSARAGDSWLKASGSINWSSSEHIFDVEFQGKNLTELGPLFDTALPPLGPYQASGHVTHTGNTHSVSEARIRLGESELAGNLSLTYNDPGTRVIGRFTADKLRVEDLVEIRDKDKSAETAARRLFPKLTIPVDYLRQMRLELDLEAAKFVIGSTDIDKLKLKGIVDGGRLNVSLSDGTVSSGHVSGDLNLDVAAAVPTASLRASVRNIDYGELLKIYKVTELMTGMADLEIDLTARGATLHELLRRANGRVVFVSGPGSVEGRTLDVWAADIVTTMLSPKWQRQKVVELNCMVARFDVTEGRAQTDAILIDTTRITVAGAGSVNLDTEELDVALKPAPKKPSLVRLATPVKVTGTIVNPKVAATKLGQLRTIGGVLLGITNPAYLVATLSDAGASKKNRCAAAIVASGTDNLGVRKEQQPSSDLTKEIFGQTRSASEE